MRRPCAQDALLAVLALSSILLSSPTLAQVCNYASGGGSAGQVAYWADSLGDLGGNNILYWNGTAARLGIGTSSPLNALDVVGTVNVTNQICLGGVCQSSLSSGGGGWTSSGSYLYNSTPGAGAGIGTAAVRTQCYMT